MSSQDFRYRQYDVSNDLPTNDETYNSKILGILHQLV